MKKNILVRGLWILGVVLVGCATTSVKSDYDPSTDFSAFKTYGWGGDSASGDLRFDDPALRQAIRQSVETELQAKGLQKAVAGNPDVLFKYYITVKEQKEVAGGIYPPVFNSRGGYAGVSGPNSYAARETMTFQYDEGTFVLDMVNPVSGKILWRGTLEGMVDPGAAQPKRVERVPGAVAKIFSKFPAGKK